MSAFGKAQRCHLWCQELSLHCCAVECDECGINLVLCKGQFDGGLDEIENCCQVKVKAPASLGKLTQLNVCLLSP